MRFVKLINEHAIAKEAGKLRQKPARVTKEGQRLALQQVAKLAAGERAAFFVCLGMLALQKLAQLYAQLDYVSHEQASV